VSTLAERTEPTFEQRQGDSNSSSSETEPGPPLTEQGVVDVAKEMDEKIKAGEYEPVATLRLDENGQERKVVMVVEERTGKEVAKDVSGGPYTMPQW
jgi:hypothetical protein